jgi:hypothetical protein
VVGFAHLAPPVASLAAFPEDAEQDRRCRGFTIGQVAWRLGIALDQYGRWKVGQVRNG